MIFILINLKSRDSSEQSGDTFVPTTTSPYQVSNFILFLNLKRTLSRLSKPLVKHLFPLLSLRITILVIPLSRVVKLSSHQLQSLVSLYSLLYTVLKKITLAINKKIIAQLFADHVFSIEKNHHHFPTHLRIQTTISIDHHSRVSKT